MQNLKLPDGKLTDSVTERLFHVVAQVSAKLLLYFCNRAYGGGVLTKKQLQQQNRHIGIVFVTNIRFEWTMVAFLLPSCKLLV